jgi:hypothetical protein
METKKPGGRGSSGPVLQRVLSFSFLLGLFLHGTVGIASADATLTVKLPKLPGAATPVLISVRSVEAETAQLLASISLKKKSSQVQLKVKALPQIVFADLFTSQGDKVSGHSHVLRPVDRKRMTVTLEMESQTLAVFPETADFPDGSLAPSTDALSSGIGLVGVPASGFTIAGLDLHPADIPPMLTTDLAGVSCYNKDGGFVVVETDPNVLAAIQAEIDLSNSTWADPSTRLQNLYVPPDYFVDGSLSSDGTNLTVTYRLVDSEGNELASKTGTGPSDDFFNIHAQVAKDLTNAMCCGKSQKVKCAKTASIDIDFDYDILHPECPASHQSYQGTIQLTPNSSVTDPQAACEYSGGGTSHFQTDGVCADAFIHTTCTIAETVVGKVVKPAFPLCSSFVVDFTEVWDCVTVDNAGTQYSTFPGSFTEFLQYKNGYVLDVPLDPALAGHARIILHLK